MRSSTPLTLPDDATRRRDRYVTRSRIQELTDGIHARRKWCGYPTADAGGVGVLHGIEAGGLRGVQHCASPWLCSVCAATIGSRRSAELAAAVDAWRLHGGDVVMVTLTMRHHQGHALRQCRDGYADAWAAATSGRAWRNGKEDATVEGYTRSTELTVGVNGWHLHAHVLLFTRQPYGQVGPEVKELAQGMFARWSSKLVKRGLPAPIAASGGLDVSFVTGDPRAIGEYLTKQAAAADDASAWCRVSKVPVARPGEHGKDRNTAGARLANEATRADLKKGRGGNRTMWQVISDYLERGDEADLTLWREYERTMPGAHPLVWSRGLRAELAKLTATLDVAEHSDEDIVAEDHGGEVIGVLEPRGFGHAVRHHPGVVADIVTAAGAPTPSDALARVMQVVDTYNLARAADDAPPWSFLHFHPRLLDPTTRTRADEGERAMDELAARRRANGTFRQRTSVVATPSAAAPASLD